MGYLYLFIVGQMCGGANCPVTERDSKAGAQVDLALAGATAAAVDRCRRRVVCSCFVRRPAALSRVASCLTQNLCGGCRRMISRTLQLHVRWISSRRR